MVKLKYTLLILSLIALAVGFSDARDNVIFYLGRPVGAILFGLFMVTQVMQKESALYDEQNRAPELVPVRGPVVKQQFRTIPQEMAHNPVLTTAHPH